MKRKAKQLPTSEHRQMTRQEFLEALQADLDPMNYAGEGYSATDEIARPRDVAHNPHLYARVMGEGEEHPTPKLNKILRRR